jgi:alpha-beta hydrolase superfamily lysophospholipase
MLTVLRALAASCVVLVLAGALAWWAARPVAPDRFYAPPATLPASPGTLLRQEAFERNVPPDARAWRILYSTTRDETTPAVASAIVMVSRQPASGPRPVVAWTHGTTGVMPGCAPSLLPDPFQHVPALAPLLDNGWIYVATDYVGQGTAGPHPYLIGAGQARSALDAVRAARQVDGLLAGERTVVWGHSQGGHAALWTGILAPSYAPELQIAGVAAAAPASDLRPMIDVVQHGVVGRIMTSYVLQAYSETYADVRFDGYASPWKRALARDMAGRCLAGLKALYSVAEALAAGGTIFGVDPASGPLGERLAQNTPDRPIAAPLLIAQGLADDLVLPDLQSRFVARRCRDGQVVDYRQYAARDHLSLVAPDSPLTADLVAWTRERFAGSAAPATCSSQNR